MAGRTVHYTLGVLLARDLPKAESGRFLLGSLRTCFNLIDIIFRGGLFGLGKNKSV